MMNASSIETTRPLPAMRDGGTDALPRGMSDCGRLLTSLAGADDAVGWRGSTMVRPGLSIEASEWRFNGEQAFQVRGDDTLKLHFRVSGGSTLRLSDGTCFEVKPGSMSYLVHPEDAVKQEFIDGDIVDRSITYVCSKDFSRSLLDDYADELPKCVRAFVSGKSDWMAAGSVAMPTTTWPIVEALLRPEPETAFQRLIYEAQALELLHHALANILQIRPAATVIRERDRKRVRDACAMLEDMGPPLSLREMSRLLAWNETQMMECFKRVTGTTISSYRNRVRMRNALHELKTTDLSVSEVAFNAGYDYPGNFAAAFKRMFGFTPRSAQS